MDKTVELEIHQMRYEYEEGTKYTKLGNVPAVERKAVETGVDIATMQLSDNVLERVKQDDVINFKGTDLLILQVSPLIEKNGVKIVAQPYKIANDSVSQKTLIEAQKKVIYKLDKALAHKNELYREKSQLSDIVKKNEDYFYGRIDSYNKSSWLRKLFTFRI